MTLKYGSTIAQPNVVQAALLSTQLGSRLEAIRFDSFETGIHIRGSCPKIDVCQEF